MSNSGKTAAGEDAGAASLPALVARLGEDIINLVDSKLSLLKIEVHEDLRGYGRGLVAVGMAAVVAAVGFALLNAALALVIAHLLHGLVASAPLQYAIGFAATGVVYLVAGTTIALRARARLVARDPRPEETLTEIAKDKAWLTGEPK